MSTSAKINRNYKDRLFRFLFNDKENLLELYNAVNDTAYTNPEDLSITTKDTVIYMTMKNDLSFLISGEMNLYEHQSSRNPNIPLPQAVVFYNGLQEEPVRQIFY